MSQLSLVHQVQCCQEPLIQLMTNKLTVSPQCYVYKLESARGLRLVWV